MKAGFVCKNRLFIVTFSGGATLSGSDSDSSSESWLSSSLSSSDCSTGLWGWAGGCSLETGGGFADVFPFVNASVLPVGVTDTGLSSPSSSSSSSKAGFVLARGERNQSCFYKITVTMHTSKTAIASVMAKMIILITTHRSQECHLCGSLASITVRGEDNNNSFIVMWWSLQLLGRVDRQTRLFGTAIESWWMSIYRTGPKN